MGIKKPSPLKTSIFAAMFPGDNLNPEYAHLFSGDDQLIQLVKTNLGSSMKVYANHTDVYRSALEQLLQVNIEMLLWVPVTTSMVRWRSEVRPYANTIYVGHNGASPESEAGHYCLFTRNV